jgi:hypothetical protein
MPDGTSVHWQLIFAVLVGSAGLVDGVQGTPRHQAQFWFAALELQI